jgi:hypothetical protein
MLVVGLDPVEKVVCHEKHASLFHNGINNHIAQTWLTLLQFDKYNDKRLDGVTLARDY